MTKKTIEIAGPYFEDFYQGQVLEPAPSVTITCGYAALHQALFADRLRLPLDRELCQKVTGRDQLFVNPHLLYNLATGQTTYASQHVKGNLFYRGLIFKKPVFIDDTLTTSTTVVALRQNQKKEGRPASGMVVLEIRVTNQHQEDVLFFWRCPMIPCRDPHAETGHADNLDTIPAQIEIAEIEKALPPHWKLDVFQKEISGMHFDQVEEGIRYQILARDTITSAPELARLTLNMARAHTDQGASSYDKRLVYGGHTISMAAAQTLRALPNIVTVMAWKSCQHTAPIFEGDVLQTEVTVMKKHALARIGGLVELQAEVWAHRDEPDQDRAQGIKVLDWEWVVLMA